MDPIDELIEQASAARAEGRFDDTRSLSEQVVAALTPDTTGATAGKLALAHFNLGLLDEGDEANEDARAHYVHAARLHRECAARSTAPEATLLRLSRALTTDVYVARASEPEHAEPLFGAALDQLYALADQHPDSAAVAEALAESIGVYAVHSSDIDDFDRAMELGEELLEVTQRPAFSSSDEAAESVVEALEVLTEAAYDSGQTARALFFGRQLVSRARMLADADPAAWRWALSARLALAEIEEEAGEPATARALIDEATAIDRRMLTENVGHRLDHSAIPALRHQAGLSADADDLVAAQARLAVARELIELAPRDPNVDYWRCAVAIDQCAVCADAQDVEGARRHLVWARLAFARIPDDDALMLAHESRSDMEAALVELEEMLT